MVLCSTKPRMNSMIVIKVHDSNALILRRNTQRNRFYYLIKSKKILANMQQENLKRKKMVKSPLNGLTIKQR